MFHTPLFDPMLHSSNHEFVFIFHSDFSRLHTCDVLDSGDDDEDMCAMKLVVECPTVQCSLAHAQLTDIVHWTNQIHAKAALQQAHRQRFLTYVRAYNTA